MINNLFGSILILIGGILSIFSLIALIVLALAVSLVMIILCIPFAIMAAGISLIS